MPRIGGMSATSAEGVWERFFLRAATPLMARFNEGVAGPVTIRRPVVPSLPGVFSEVLDTASCCTLLPAEAFLSIVCGDAVAESVTAIANAAEETRDITFFIVNNGGFFD